MKTVSCEEVREQLESLICTSMNDHEHFRIATDDGAVVMIPEETYNNIIVTLELLSTPGLFDGLKKREVIQSLQCADLAEICESECAEVI